MGKKIITVVFMALLACALTAQLAFASTLDLIGVGWTKSNLTVLIKAPPSVSDAAQDDVVAAIDDWNTANAGVSGAPEMDVVTGVKTADITIRMKVGGGSVLGVTMTKTERFSPVTKSVSIQLSGKAFGTNFSSAGTGNVARHELGHALGLGHADDADDLMYAYADSSEIFGNTEVGISSCDTLGIDTIYPFVSPYTLPSSVTCP